MRYNNIEEQEKDIEKMQFKGLETYDSLAYKVMCVMDIMLDLDQDYRTYFKSSEDMFKNLTDLLVGFEDQDDGSGCWYDKIGLYLEGEYDDN